MFGLSMVALVIAFVLVERKGWKAPDWAVAVGNASYSIYLLHLTIFSIVLRVTERFGSWAIGSAIAFLAVITLSLAYSQIYELPFVHWSRGKLLPQAA